MLSYSYGDISESIDGIAQEAYDRLKPEIERLRVVHEQGFSTRYDFMRQPYDHATEIVISAVVLAKQALKPRILVLVGIGGSSSGTVALQQALLGLFYNDTLPPMRIYYADTVDDRLTHDIAGLVELELVRGNAVLIVVVSKSGTTTETLINASLYTALLQKYHKDNYRDYFVIITEYQSPLWYMAEEHKFTVLEIPRHVSGRYSVFSAASLLPLKMLGIDTSELLHGARSITSSCVSYTDNNAARTAALVYAYYKQGRVMHDLFLFAPHLAGLGAWYRQLMAESLGKKQLTDEGLETGITPLVSLGTVDLHSVVQLYLGGPHDKFTTFVTIARNAYAVDVPVTVFSSLQPYSSSKSLLCIKQAIIEGLSGAYRNGGRPFMMIELSELSPYSLGEFMQCQMIMMTYLGYLLGVNPFDQPEVEMYKSITRDLLSAS
jgi:glucose-6-phosphate isomerase